MADGLPNDISSKNQPESHIKIFGYIILAPNPLLAAVIYEGSVLYSFPSQEAEKAQLDNEKNNLNQLTNYGRRMGQPDNVKLV